MLPFLTPKKAAGLIIARRKPDGGIEMVHEEQDDEASDGLGVAAKELVRAIHAGDIASVKESLRAAFQILESEPHEEFEAEE